MKKVRFSIITVCLNAEKSISKTIRSVLRQTCNDYEYIIWDGKSSDKTLQLADSYRRIFENKNIDFKILSAEDLGIYDAMNKAVAHADGQWVIFLNAGDFFYNASVLNKVSECLDNSGTVYYGNVINDFHGLKEKNPAKPIEHIRRFMPFCHQAVFTRRELFDSYHFNCKYKIAADYDLYLKAYLDGVKFVKVPFYIACFNTEGVSYSDSYNRELEFLKIRVSRKLISNREFAFLKFASYRFLVRDVAKGILGSKRIVFYKKWIKHKCVK